VGALQEIRWLIVGPRLGPEAIPARSFQHDAMVERLIRVDVSDTHGKRCFNPNLISYLAFAISEFRVNWLGELSSAKEFNVTELVKSWDRTELISVRPGEILFREGDEGHALYIVEKGNLRVMSGSVVYETVTAGGILGEMALIDEGAPRSASVIAVSHAQLWEIDTDKFRSMVASDPNFAITVMRTMARRLRIMNQRYRPGAW
jgi:CRP/FNR family transcriptional regulator, cyclic AMP receptor protein